MAASKDVMSVAQMDVLTAALTAENSVVWRVALTDIATADTMD